MLKATLKALLAHKLRFALTTVAVLLGVTFVSGTYAFTDTMDDVFSSMIEDSTAGVDVYVQPRTAFESTSDFGTASPGFPEEVAEAVRGVEGVAAAEPALTGYAQFIDKDGEAITPVGPPTLGVSWNPNDGLNALEMVSGRAPAGGNEVAMDATTAEEHGFRVGDSVEILLLGPQKTFEVVGTFAHEDPDVSFAGATLAAFDLETAQKVFDKPGVVDTIEIAAEAGVSAEELVANVTQVLPRKVEAVTSASLTGEMKDQVGEGMGYFTTVLLVFAAIAVFVGGFIIFNTFSITVSQRLREFGLLRAIGASGRQVMSSVVGEATVVGLVASVAGMFAGLGAAIGLSSLMNAFGFDLPQSTPRLEPRTIVVALVVGIGVTIVAAIVPALRAARIEPIQAMQEVHSAPSRVRKRRVAVAGVVTFGGAALLATGLFANVDQEIEYVGAGATLLFLGVAMFGPLLARPVTGVLSKPLPGLFGITGTLARQNSIRSPRRTASTAAALMVGLAVVTIVAVFGASLKASVNAAVDEGMTSDLVLMPNSSMPMQTFSTEVGETVAALPQIEVASPFRMGEWESSGGGRATVMAVDPESVARVLDLEVTDGSIEALGNGGLLVKRSVAEDDGLAVGDTIEMTFPATGMQRVQVDGIYDATTDDRYLLSMTTYEDVYPKQQDIQVHLVVAEGVGLAEAQRAVEGVLDHYPNVKALTRDELRGEMGSMVDRLLNMVYALLGLTLLIAMMGITNTLALSIHERRKELGLLRAVGATQRQLRRMIRWEAATVTLFGTILGIALGSVVAWALVESLADMGFRKLAFPYLQLAAFVLVAGVAGILAAALPARRAARVDVLKAVAVE